MALSGENVNVNCFNCSEVIVNQAQRIFFISIHKVHFLVNCPIFHDQFTKIKH